MTEPVFFPQPAAITIADIVALTAAVAAAGVDLRRTITGAAALETAGPGDITFADTNRYDAEAASTRAGACLCTQRTAKLLPPNTIPLVSDNPHRAFAQIVARMYPAAMRPNRMSAGGPAGFVADTARLEAGVVVEAGAVVSDGAEIGRGTIVGPNAVIGPSVRIGRDCSIGAGSTVQHALLGDRVILHPGVQIGHDGFGFVPSPSGHMKVPQIGRVLIQDDVEVGAGTTIDRGSTRDTVIGQGTKIDNQVQIGHNVWIGRHCLIAGQVGVAGSAKIGDFVMIGGQSGVNSHIVIGDGAQIAGVSAVHRDVPAGEKWAGTPARPVWQWLRAQARDLEEARAAARRKRDERALPVGGDR